MAENKLTTDIAVIKNELKNINKLLINIDRCNREYDNRITENEKKITAIDTKIGLFAGVQLLFTTAVGAVISFFKI